MNGSINDFKFSFNHERKSLDDYLDFPSHWLTRIVMFNGKSDGRIEPLSREHDMNCRVARPVNWDVSNREFSRSGSAWYSPSPSPSRSSYNATEFLPV